MFQLHARKTLLLATCLICATASAEASSVTFTGEFSAESDKIFFHGTTTELSPGDQPLNIIYATSTGAAAGGFATSISYWEPTGGAHGFVGTEFGHPDAQASRQIAGTDYYFALTMLGNDPVGDFNFNDAFAPGGAGTNTVFALDGLTDSAYCAAGVGMFCQPTDPLTPRTSHWSLTFTNFDSVEQLSSAVPIPPAFSLFASGLAGLGWFGTRKRKSPQTP